MSDSRVYVARSGSVVFRSRTAEEVLRETSPAWAYAWLLGTRRMAELDLRPTSFRVFLYLVSDLDYKNKVIFRQEDLAKCLRKSQSQISKALNELRDQGLITRIDDVEESDKSRSMYMINPHFFYRGPIKRLLPRKREYQRHSGNRS